MFKKANHHANIDEFIANVRKEYGDSCTAPILSCTIARNACGGCKTPVLEFSAFTHQYCADTLRTHYDNEKGIVRVDINRNQTAWNYEQGVTNIRIALPPSVQAVKANFRTWRPKYSYKPFVLPSIDITCLVDHIQKYASPTSPNSCWDHLQPGTHIEYLQLNWKLQPCLVFYGFTGPGVYRDTIRIRQAGDTCILTINGNANSWPPWGGPHKNIMPLRAEIRVVKARHDYWEPKFRVPKLPPS